MPEIKEPKQSQSEQFKERRLRDNNSSNETPRWFNELVGKPLPYRLRWAVQKHQAFRENKEKATSQLMFELEAYANSPKDAISQGLVTNEQIQWMRNHDDKLQVLRIQKPDGTVSPITHPVCASDEPLRRTRDELNILTSLITDTVREANLLYPDLIAMESVLACVCETQSLIRCNVPEWAKLERLKIPKLERLKIPDGSYGLECGDLSVVSYWSTLQPELLQLAINIEQYANDEFVNQANTQAAGDGGESLVDDLVVKVVNHKKPRRKHNSDSGSKLKRDVKMEILKQFLEECRGWDGTLKELKVALLKKTNLKLSVSTLSRYLKGTKYKRKGNPHRSSKALGNSSIEREAVANNKGAAERSNFEAWTMPKDETPFS